MRYQTLFNRLKTGLGRAAVWRQGINKRRPGDARNAEAIKSLRALARARYEDVKPEAWAIVALYADGPSFSDAVDAANRAEGFHRHSVTFTDYLLAVAAFAKGFEAPATGGAP